MRKTFIVLFLFFVLAVAAVFLPYREWLENRLEKILEAKGFESVSLTISTLGVNSASLENVSIGGEKKLNLKNIVLEYSLLDLWKGNLRDLALSGVDIDIQQTNAGWVAGGLENWSARPEEGASKPFTIPVTAQQLAGIPFDRFKFDNSSIDISSVAVKLSMPLDLSWRKTPEPEISFNSANPALKFGAVELTAANLEVSAVVNEGKRWESAWTLKDVNTNGASIPVPVLNGAGDLLADETHVEIQGKLASADKAWLAEFTVNNDLANPEKSELKVLKAGMPWKSGRVDIRNVKIPFEGKNPIQLTLDVKSVSIQELMQSLTGNRVSATGKVSGSLPLIIERNGNIKALPGNLKSEGPGAISLPPDVIPGDNEQVSLVRQILGNLQYTGLTIAIENNKNGRLGVLMTFEGNNPKVYEGRPVKLNVNLTGDVLEFVQQNILFLTNPEQFLKQGNDEKN